MVHSDNKQLTEGSKVDLFLTFWKTQWSAWKALQPLRQGAGVWAQMQGQWAREQAVYLSVRPPALQHDSHPCQACSRSLCAWRMGTVSEDSGGLSLRPSPTWVCGRGGMAEFIYKKPPPARMVKVTHCWLGGGSSQVAHVGGNWALHQFLEGLSLP